MPTGKVKWYDSEKGFGFLTQDDGEDVYLPGSALPSGVSTLKTGQRVNFGLVTGKRGPQALSIHLIEPTHSVVATTRAAAQAKRRPAEELHGMVEDTIKMIEAQVQPELRKKKYPDNRTCERVAGVLRALAQELDPIA